MLFRIVFLVRVFVSLAIAASQDLNFTFYGFRSTNLSLDGLAELTSNGLLRLTNVTYHRTRLFYLHEEWEQVVIHRDVKASNVLLDGELNARLGDFGLARLYDHGTDPQTTHVVGTLGYLAPEHARTGKATTSTDVFAFGAFLLEVASGRRPLQPTEDIILVDWVFSRWLGGEILEARDPNLGTEYIGEEMELVLKLGLMCSHSKPAARPSMRQVVQFLEGNVPLPDISPLCLSASGLTFSHREASSDVRPTNSGHVVFAAGFDPNPYIPKTCQNQSIHKWKT
ncbi:hypothetical protein POTOM_022949 [Populus tomentosa]|uniref:non-specific serine/threonine protein kinase n=1 Tax=Populus tomentosa TaxID=118781 RepID=A0A8X8CZ16_POPTO|nr:hypothetical protein POTOM_022949 [Populus tomentosa]